MPIEPKRELELVHLQLTKRCNLHCWFCGQWGKNGSFRQKAGEELTSAEWLNAARELTAMTARQPRPSVVLWGGEPLLSPCFGEISDYLYRQGFPLGMVTNGTLLESQLERCRTQFCTIYISLDGTPAIHDAIRGAGTYERVARNIRALQGGRARIVLMTVLTKETRENLKAVLDGFRQLSPDEVLLQERIALAPQEIGAYAGWLRDSFGQTARDIFAWSDAAPEPQTAPDWYARWLSENPYPFPVHHLPHGAYSERRFCLSPWRHLHIAWNGETGFCTDFSDFSCGNVRDTPIPALFAGEKAQKFAAQTAAGRCPACQHCSWLNSERFVLDG
jgi:sulfatase maturation enzyme AslB (radical SAM superfamily)